MKEKLSRFDWLNFVLPVVFLVLWTLLPPLVKTPEYLIPPLPKVFRSFVEFIFGNPGAGPYTGEFLHHSKASGLRVLSGFFIAAGAGLTIGILTASFRTLGRLVDPFVHILRTVPGIGWFPIFMVWFGVGNKTTILLIALAAFFPIYLNTLTAIREVPVELSEVAADLGAQKKDIILRVLLPVALPGIVTGLRLGMGICWSFLVLGELTGVNEGLGAVMMNARMLGDIDMIIVSMIAISLWGKLSDSVIRLIFRRSA